MARQPHSTTARLGLTPHLAARMRNKRVSRWATSSSSVAIKIRPFSVSFRPEDGLKAKVFFPPNFFRAADGSEILRKEFGYSRDVKMLI